MNLRRWSMALALAVASQGALADEFLPRAGLQVIYSDNIRRQATTIESDTVVTAHAGFHYIHDSERWNADVAAMGSYTEFLEDTFDSRTLGASTLTAGVTILPRYLTWDLQNNYGQVAVDSFGAIEPTDRENTNYLTTGPTLTIPIGRSRIEVHARYSDVLYEDTHTLDNTRTSVQAALIHPWTDIRTLSLNLFQQETKFERTDLFRNYDLRSAYLALRSTPRRSIYQFELGVTEVDDGITVSDGMLMGLTYGHQITASTSLQIYGRSGFADSADTFRLEQGASSDPIIIDNNVQLQADPYEESRIDIAFVSTRARGSYSVMPYWVDENYVNNDQFDRTRAGVRADASYSFGGVWRLDGFISGEEYQYVDSSFDHRDVQVAVGLTRVLSPAVQLLGRVERFDRSSDVDSYTENRVTLLLSYAPASRTRRDPADPTRMLNRARGINSQPAFGAPPGNTQ